MMRLICILKNVKIGDNSQFYGFTKFKRGSKGKIAIGNNCTFRSFSTSNLIGINRPCIISAIGSKPSKITIGNNCGFSGTVIGCFTEIQIDDNVRCGANTLITDSDWHLDDLRIGNPRPIILNDNVFLGANVTVLKGVTIGENTIIGAGSVVVKSVPANVIAAGNPCEIIRGIAKE